MTTLGDAAARGGIQTGPFGSQLHAEDYVQSGVGVVMPQDIGDNEVDGSRMARITPERAESLARHRLRPGDIVFSRRGDVTRRALVKVNADAVICGTGCLRVRVDETRANPRYVSYAVGTPEAKAWLIRHAVGATMANLNTRILSALPLSLPPLAVQAAIGEVLGALDDKIAANRRALELGKALLDARWSEISAHSTESVPLADIVEISPRVPQCKDGEPPYLDMKNLPEHGLLVADWGSRAPRGGTRFRNGDTLVARITPCFENGKMAWVDFLDVEETGYGSTEYIVLRAKRGIPRLVPYVIAASPGFRTFAARHRTGTSGRQRVQARELAAYEVSLPSAGHLATFGTFAETLAARLGAARTESRRLTTTRDELLPLLMSGRITVKDAERRVEEEV
ncbi:MAG: restriction endonuclease subunit S [Solirubrobacteraceae bacterium]|nr:restriction endonuclease subunit S [Solirubrobacteraceae bacterium]